MITTRVLGNGGRLGNALFHYAAIIGMASKHGHTVQLPSWEYDKYFYEDFPEGDIRGYEYHETTFHYNQEYVDALKDISIPFDLKGYFQTEKYWDHCIDRVRTFLKFQPELIEQVRTGFEKAFEKPTIAISIRRGDYVQNPNYHNLPISHYLTALFEHFPDWQDQNIIVFSDDIPYCRVHFDCLDNVWFSENNSDIEDICLMSQCTNFIIANSSFSWWGAYLGEPNGGKIVRPAYHFEGSLKQKADSKDFYPERWLTHDYAGKKLNLSDITFTIPVQYDHVDRKKNLALCVCMLQHHFTTNITVMENRGDMFASHEEHCDYRQSEHPVFHRTRMLNDMAKEATTEFVANWDADVVIPPLQIWKMVDALRKSADMVFPYDGRFARIPRIPWFVKLECFMDIGIVGDTRFNGMEANAAVSVGGAVAWNREAFLKAGGENENFISFGAEDQERVVRAETLGLRIDRIGGCLFHVNHYVGPDSSTRNPYFHHNREEFEKVKGMDKEELINYIETWDK